MTKRQRLEAHRTEPACANCHSKMDPLGLPLETFDAIGRYRTTDHGLPIDPSGDFNGTAVADARGLGTAAAASATVAQCFVRKFYTYAVGHEERGVDGGLDRDRDRSRRGKGHGSAQRHQGLSAYVRLRLAGRRQIRQLLEGVRLARRSHEYRRPRGAPERPSDRW
jgi:hypothetical protein